MVSLHSADDDTEHLVADARNNLAGVIEMLDEDQDETDDDNNDNDNDNDDEQEEP